MPFQQDFQLYNGITVILSLFQTVKSNINPVFASKLKISPLETDINFLSQTIHCFTIMHKIFVTEVYLHSADGFRLIQTVTEHF